MCTSQTVWCEIFQIVGLMLYVLRLQIHLRQFHGTRYAAISPSMVSAEELQVHESHLSNKHNSADDDDDNQWDSVPLPSKKKKTNTVAIFSEALISHNSVLWSFQRTFSRSPPGQGLLWSAILNQLVSGVYFYFTDEAIFWYLLVHKWAASL